MNKYIFLPTDKLRVILIIVGVRQCPKCSFQCGQESGSNWESGQPEVNKPVFMSLTVTTWFSVLNGDIKTILTQLSTDPDFDVRYFAEQAKQGSFGVYCITIKMRISALGV